MKRDMDLIRKILFYIEDNYVAGGSYISVDIEGYTEGEIYEHCMLAYQGGLISEPLQTGTFDGKSCMVGNLTNEGFDLLENIRQDTFWNKTKKVAFELPKDRTENCLVSLYLGSTQVIEDTVVPPDMEALDVVLTGSGTQTYVIYINNQEYEKVKVDFDAND